MANAFHVRCTALAVTAGLCLLWRDSPAAFRWATYSLGFAHYFLALRYSTRQLGDACAAPTQLLALLGLLMLSFALYYDGFPLVACFGVHHVLNEAYHGRPVWARGPAPTRLQAAGVALHAAAYIFILRADASFGWVDWQWALPALLVATAVFSRELRRARDVLAGARLFELCGSELAAGILVAASLFFRITFLQVVLYHFVLWALLPVARVREQGRRKLFEYVALSGVLVAVALLLSPLGPSQTRLEGLLFSQQFLFWSYAHITLSFALSDAQPSWMCRLFRGDAGVPSAVRPG